MKKNNILTCPTVESLSDEGFAYMRDCVNQNDEAVGTFIVSTGDCLRLSRRECTPVMNALYEVRCDTSDGFSNLANASRMMS